MVGLSKKSQELITQIGCVIEQYGTMTVRQVYYQLVTQGYDYRQVAYGLAKARELGLVNLNRIIDRSRPTYGMDTWENPAEVLDYYKKYYQLDYWADEQIKVEIWTEKDALSQILYEEAARFRVPVRVTRGFLSISNQHAWSNENNVILYFGDFDPSGLCIDFSLSNNVYLEYAELHRIALTPEQLDQYDLPSVPVKANDTRSKDYVKQYGNRGWELDALNPMVLRILVKNSIEQYITFDLKQKMEKEAGHRLDFDELAQAYKEATRDE